MASSAPKPTSSLLGSPATAGAPSRAITGSSGVAPPPSSTVASSPQSACVTPSSELGRKFAQLTARLQNTREKLATCKTESDHEFYKHEITDINSTIQKLFAELGELEVSYAETKSDAASILARRTDVMRDVDTSQRILSSRSRKDDDDFLSQPLDAKNEKLRREVNRLFFNTDRRMQLLEYRLKVQEKLKQERGATVLCQEILNTYNDANQFGKEADKYLKEVQEMESKPVNRYQTVESSRALKPYSQPNHLAQVSKKGAIDKFLSIGIDEFGSLAAPTTSSFSFVDVSNVGSLSSKPESPYTERIPLVGGGASSRQLSHSSSVAKSIFSPPRSTLPRQQWQQQSSVDQAKASHINFSSPRELSQTTIDSVSRTILNNYGTSPEKLRGYSAVRSNPPVTAPGENTASSREQEASTQSDRSAVVSGSSFLSASQTSSTEKANPKKTTNSLSFGVKSPPRPSAGGDITAPAAASQPKASGTTTSDQNESKPTAAASIKPSVSSSSGLGSMSGLGQASLFSAEMNLSSAGQKASTSPSSSGTGSTDFRALLMDFYHKHNQSKVAEVDKTLQKYKVRFC